MRTRSKLESLCASITQAQEPKAVGGIRLEFLSLPADDQRVAEAWDAIIKDPVG